LDGTSQQQDNLHDFLILGNHFIEGSLLVVISVGLFPVEKFLGTSQHGSGSLVDRELDLFLAGVELHLLKVQLEINLEERLGAY